MDYRTLVANSQVEEDEEATLLTCCGLVELNALVEGTTVATVTAAVTDNRMDAGTCCEFAMENEQPSV